MFYTLRQSKFIEKNQFEVAKQRIKENPGGVQELEETRYKFNGHVILQADKSLTYRLLRKILFTAGASDFTLIHGLAVSIGMVAAAKIATALGKVTKNMNQKVICMCA